MILRNEPQRHRVHRERISASVLGHFFIWKSLKANLSGAFLLQANLSGANLSEANLSGADLTAAMMPDGTIHP
ncbi:MAG: pentapeptide repeat-containing protein [Dolichospermum sp. DEX189]|nr:pentapeptide repeat-containing protein [Dolichospermum sp. DEX189]